MWDGMAKTLVDTIQDDYAIVFMDFKVDVERLIKAGSKIKSEPRRDAK